MSRVVIGMDPHKRSATIEVIDERERVLGRGRYGTDTDGYQRMLAAGRRFAERVWAMTGHVIKVCAGHRSVGQQAISERCARLAAYRTAGLVR
ncbi:hypothetical protein ABZS66_55555 [Dactylosporangium sp. NPDC005572]|uniref:hypothetical protein n=1 Tax=Dactylosporangium sp. NPDC005572 TaxID=3156889 RepID=UPI0033B26554